MRLCPCRARGSPSRLDSNCADKVRIVVDTTFDLYVGEGAERVHVERLGYIDIGHILKGASTEAPPRRWVTARWNDGRREKIFLQTDPITPEDTRGMRSGPKAQEKAESIIENYWRPGDVLPAKRWIVKNNDALLYKSFNEL